MKSIQRVSLKEKDWGFTVLKNHSNTRALEAEFWSSQHLYFPAIISDTQWCSLKKEHFEVKHSTISKPTAGNQIRPSPAKMAVVSSQNPSKCAMAGSVFALRIISACDLPMKFSSQKSLAPISWSSIISSGLKCRVEIWNCCKETMMGVVWVRTLGFSLRDEAGSRDVWSLSMTDQYSFFV